MYLKINEEIYKMLANFQFYFALFTTGSYFLIELIRYCTGSLQRR